MKRIIPRIPRLEVDIRLQRSRQPEPVLVPFWATMWRSRPTARGSFHTRTARSLPLCTMVTSRRRKTTRSLAKPNLSFLAPHERSVYGQRLHEVRRDARLGVRHLRRRQARRRGVNEILLPLPQSGQG